MSGSGTTLDDYTDRYAQRVRGMTASEIRALFAVANRPEVVSLAGGAPYTAALPLDAVGEMLGRLVADTAPPPCSTASARARSSCASGSAR